MGLPEVNALAVFRTQHVATVSQNPQKWFQLLRCTSLYFALLRFTFLFDDRTCKAATWVSWTGVIFIALRSLRDRFGSEIAAHAPRDSGAARGCAGRAGGLLRCARLCGGRGGLLDARGCAPRHGITGVELSTSVSSSLQGAVCVWRPGPARV